MRATPRTLAGPALALAQATVAVAVGGSVASKASRSSWRSRKPDAAELLLRLHNPDRGPAQDHLAVAPALDIAGHGPSHRDHGLDGVGRLEGPEQAGAESKAGDRERLLEASRSLTAALG